VSGCPKARNQSRDTQVSAKRMEFLKIYKYLSKVSQSKYVILKYWTLAILATVS
jgi:hypothetical protein